MKNNLNENKITTRSKLKRIPERGSYDLNTIYGILDESVFCNIGFCLNEQTFVIPVAFGRKNDEIYFHGAKAGRIFKALRTGIEICISVTIIDGIVLARSAFHHSMNYRSVVLFGKPEEIVDPAEKLVALKSVLEHIVPGRWSEIREPNKKELNATSVFRIKINEASAKIRTGPPIDGPEDLFIKVWAGILPVKTIAGKPLPDVNLDENIPVPENLRLGI